jgi:ATP-dependent helicase HrpB
MQLPIDPHLPSILQQLESKQNVLVQSSPGSGKTTRIPPYLIRKYKKILVIEPRRIAAIYAASRIAEESQWELGGKVGYEVRFDSKKSNQTEILFLTEALLAKKIVSGPQLENIDLIIFDEFHERSFWTDLSISHIKELQILGSGIQMLFLSATIDKAPLISFFEDIGIIDIELPRYPIEVIYQKKPLRYIWNDEFENNLVQALHDVIQKGKKQILVFLPGLREIRNASRVLENSSKFKNFQIEVLHGSIPLATQKSIVTNDSGFENRIILSTNIAESSLTISGVTAVIDSGLHREAAYNNEYETTQLSTRKISYFSSVQRQGRANRLGPGICFKMWTELDERSMEKAPISDIKKSSLFELGLHLIHLGHWPLTQFTWFESPGANVLNELQQSYLDARLCENGKLTTLGELALELNLTLENAVFLILADSYFSIEKACMLISILESDYSPPDYGRASHSTLLDSLDEIQRNKNSSFEITKRSAQLLNGFTRGRSNVNWKQECFSLFQSPQQKTLLDTLSSFKKSDIALDHILAFSYMNKLCRRRRQDGNLSFRAITTKGKEVQIGDAQKANQLPPMEYFLNFNTVIDASQTAKCYSYHFTDAKVFDVAIRPFCKTISRVEFVESKQQFYKITELMLKALPIETVSTDPLAAQELKEKTVDILEAQMESLVFTIPAVEEFTTRLKLLNRTLAEPIELNWSEILDLEVKKGLSLKNRLEWAFDLESYLPYESQKLLKSLVPKELLVKDLNRSFRIQYPKDETPLIEARLQHFLGIATHPTILNNQLKLKIVLLGPHGRPIQITNDLPGFWKTSYPEIRKEMKGRYPKHAWPEDPASFKN